MARNAVLNSLAQLVAVGNTDFTSQLGPGETQLQIPGGAAPPGVPHFHLTADGVVGIREMTAGEKSTVDAQRLTDAQDLARSVIDLNTQAILDLKALVEQTVVQIQSGGDALKTDVANATTPEDALDVARNDDRVPVRAPVGSVDPATDGTS